MLQEDSEYKRGLSKASGNSSSICACLKAWSSVHAGATFTITTVTVTRIVLIITVSLQGELLQGQSAVGGRPNSWHISLLYCLIGCLQIVLQSYSLLKLIVAGPTIESNHLIWLQFLMRKRFTIACFFSHGEFWEFETFCIWTTFVCDLWQH